MIKVQIHYTTIDGVKKSKVYSYVNPAASDVTIKDFANAMYSLTTNTTGDIYKIDTAILLEDDSDDIVTPIVTTKLDPQLSLNPTSAEINPSNTGVTVTVTRLGDGAISAEVIEGGDNESLNAFTYTVSGNTIKINIMGHGYTGNFVMAISVAETDEYQAATVNLPIICQHGTPPRS